MFAAQAALDTTAQNIANAETPEYARRQVILETAPSVLTNAGPIGTGVNVREIKRAFDSLLAGQVVEFQSSFSKDKVIADILSEVEGFFQDAGETGIGGALNKFFGAIQDLANNPSGTTERTVLKSVTAQLAETFQIASQTFTQIRRGVDTEIKNMMNPVNDLTTEIARLNKQIFERNVGGTATDLHDRRDQAIRELAEMVNIRTLPQPNGSITVLLGGGRSIVDGGLASTFQTVGNSNNFGLLDVQVKDFGGAVQTVTSEITGGRLGGLINARDTKLTGYLTKLDTLASNVIQQVNLVHTLGVGTQAATSLTTDYPVTDVTEELGTVDSGLPFYSLVKDGSFDILVYDNTGTLTGTTTITIDKDPGGTTLTSLAGDLNGVTGITASVDSTTGKMTVTASGTNRFAFRGDTSQVLAAIGLNNFMKGSTANDIALGTEVAANSSLIAAGKVDGTGAFASGDNSNILNISDLENSKVLASNTETFFENFASLVGTVGNDVSDAQNGKQRSEVLLNRLEEQRSGVSGVSMEEELANLIRFQQSFSAAARLITMSQELTDSLLGLLG
jgi:flagellar hook-associated protein 1 FlgK